MNRQAPVSPIPQGYHSISPWIISGKSGEVIDFLKRVFDATEVEGSRFVNEDGSIGHAEVRIGDSVILLFDARPEWPALQSFLRVYVSNADEVFMKAIEAGSEPVTELTDLFFGDRVGRIKDPFGNIWWIQTHIQDVDQKKMEERAKDPSSIKAMKYFEDTLVWELGKNVKEPHPLDKT
jgi:PhnB protein